MDKQKWLEIFGQELKYMMEVRGVSCYALSKATGVQRQLIWSYTQGKGAPNLYTALKLAKALDCSLDIFACTDYFMEENES